MLRHLLLLAVIMCILQTLKLQGLPFGFIARAATGQPAVSSAPDQELSEAASEIGQRAGTAELAQAAGELAVAPGEDTYQRVETLMAQVPREDHALRTLWRVVARRHSLSSAGL